MSLLGYVGGLNFVCPFFSVSLRTVVFVCIRINVVFSRKAGIGKQFFVISAQFSHMLLPSSGKTISHFM